MHLGSEIQRVCREYVSDLSALDLSADFGLTPIFANNFLMHILYNYKFSGENILRRVHQRPLRARILGMHTRIPVFPSTTMDVFIQKHALRVISLLNRTK